ncbi:MAG: sulfite exporter TauE/SafE family protein [Ilumatobacter sp.]|uniref:sulfite exporter TauE/SafE family protein n=1 Tax=Ilumatobacter sp. TaxID=1967498 RepID=UPI00260DD077|nr:sulfite exporter TauE/SafE family protein [Ilumatobacter sp.]MDJ0769642.1 sulfite exporter TauE/SafE family protein [Ilumatobacter sp.]
MFTVGAIILGIVAAFVVGASKTGVPGAALVAVPMFAVVFEGRLIPGATLPVLLVADVFAVAWYRQHTRWDLLRPLATWVALGFAAGVAFFVIAGDATRTLEVGIGGIVLLIVLVQLWRLVRGQPHREADTATAAIYGTGGGFTTFVANAAGPIINTYLAGLKLPKHELVGTSAWLYLAVNVAKIPLYLALGEWSDGGRFFTADSLLYGAIVTPAVVAGVFAGRVLFRRIPQQAFLVVVLVLSAAGALNLLV